jgi:hypothetical protein
MAADRAPHTSKNRADSPSLRRQAGLTRVIPCYNEEKAIKGCVYRILRFHADELALEVIIMDDRS